MHTCTDCGYPFYGENCGNPACVRVNPEAHAKHVAEAAKRQAEQDERDRINAIRYAAMVRSSVERG